MDTRTAVLFGSTGLTGRHVLEELLMHKEFSKIVVYARSQPDVSAPNVTIIRGSLDEIEKHEDELKGDDYFCCLGTTIKKAKSKEAFRNVDLDAPVQIARIASKHGANSFIVISSIGADASSSNFYLRTKGEMENRVLSFPLRHLYILRPSMLLGSRKEFRLAERLASAVMKPVNFLLTGKLKKYRAIEAGKVASAMVKLALQPYPEKILESDTIAGM